jgi:hypothetical protein
MFTLVNTELLPFLQNCILFDLVLYSRAYYVPWTVLCIMKSCYFVYCINFPKFVSNIWYFDLSSSYINSNKFKKKMISFWQYLCHASFLIGPNGVHLMLLVSDSVSDTWQDQLLMVEKNVQILSNLAKVIMKLVFFFNLCKSLTKILFISSPNPNCQVCYCHHCVNHCLLSVSFSYFIILL